MNESTLFQLGPDDLAKIVGHYVGERLNYRKDIVLDRVSVYANFDVSKYKLDIAIEEGTISPIKKSITDNDKTQFFFVHDLEKVFMRTETKKENIDENT